MTCPFHFDKVILNLPFAPDHDPSMPRVIKLREGGEMAYDEAIYVDDTRLCGRGFALTNAACQQLVSGMNSHGNQAGAADAAKY